VADQPLLSIIVTSYTMERLNDVCGLIDSIKAQTYPDIEVVFIVESVPELGQKTAAYAREKGLTRLTVLFHDGEPGLSASRNAGIDKAQGDIVAFVDDDVVLFPDWAAEMVKTYNDDSVIGVTGPALPLWQDKSLTWFPEELYWILSCTAWSGWTKQKDVRNAWGMNMSFKKEAIIQAGLFKSNFGLCDSNAGWHDPPSEDVDISLRVKAKTDKRIIYNPDVKVNHRVYPHRVSLKFVARRAYSVGYQRRMFKKLYPETDRQNEMLQDEHSLLKRIVFQLFPSSFAGLFVHPVRSWRRLRVTIIAVTFVALGYI
jgi:glucosyl-dolichyl phosphate glucuronosyltransferase